MLSALDQDRIAEAVTKAEAATSGEILVVAAGEVSRYREVPLGWAAIAALVLPTLVVALSLAPLTSLVGDVWTRGQSGALERDLSVALTSFAIIQIALFVIVSVVVSIPSVRRAMTPRLLKAHRVAQAAHHQFLSMGSRAGPAVTGVLIFVAVVDRQVQILADAGIHQKCGEAPWGRAAAAITGAMKKGADPTSGIVEAVAICGAALAEHYPSSGPHEPAFTTRPLEV